MLKKIKVRLFLLRRKSFCICHKEMKSLQKFKFFKIKTRTKQKALPTVSSPPLWAQQLVVKFKIYADSTGEGRKK